VNQKAVKRYRREVKRYLASAHKEMFLEVFKHPWYRRIKVAFILIFKIGYKRMKKENQ
jgi:hypothetical protein